MPIVLKVLVAFILVGLAPIEQLSETGCSNDIATPCLQMLEFSRKQSSFNRLNNERETHVLIYVSLTVHAEIRKKELVDTFGFFGDGDILKKTCYYYLVLDSKQRNPETVELLSQEA
ncbi:hypothetical protein PoB_000273600 [Plakobranchus ocellatus]|uniref:Uncharacterized protein n=1 Tax=Plakobranchus ocellatus TaxID=259542 RepID=A0AAV3XZH8_9GAST|nr:hypothetical protein PoB_000273600 [Plakobranchus ocellatus]